jgi:hypothetical protein
LDLTHVILVLDVFLTLFKNEAPTDVSLKNYIVTVLPVCSNRSSPLLLNQLSDLARSHSEHLPICFDIASSHDSNSLDVALLENVRPQTVSQPALIWAVLCFLKGADFAFALLLSSAGPILTILAGIDVLVRAYAFEVWKAKSRFIRDVISQVRDSDSRNGFLKLVIYVILFQESSYSSPAFVDFGSLFGNVVLATNEFPVRGGPEIVKHRLTSAASQRTVWNLELHIDFGGHWLDAALASLCASQIEGQELSPINTLLFYSLNRAGSRHLTR